MKDIGIVQGVGGWEQKFTSKRVLRGLDCAGPVIPESQQVVLRGFSAQVFGKQ
jgi:hypothetical protein